MKKLLITLLLLLTLTGCQEAAIKDPLTKTFQELSIPTEITETTVLPQTENGIDIIWSTDIEDLLHNNQVQGVLYNQSGVLTATLTYEGITLYKSVEVDVSGTSGMYIEEAILLDVVDQYVKTYEFDEHLVLPYEASGVTFSYTSTNQDYITDTLDVTEPLCSVGAQTVTINVTATITDYSETFDVIVQIPCVNEAPLYTGYYAGADDLTGDILKQFLHDLIDDHHVLTYDEVKYALRDTDEDPNNPNNVILLYTGRSQAKTAFGGGADDYNREHVWAKSHGGFGNDMGPGTDLHHIRPTDASVNSSRGNLDFGEGGSVVMDGSTATENYKTSSSFEPRDEVKGDVARMLFYMAVRYEGDDYLDLELSRDSVTGSIPYIGDLDILLQWHIEDPVDEFEMDRNDAIESYQGNRNPFIDHPEFVELIWGD